MPNYMIEILNRQHFSLSAETLQYVSGNDYEVKGVNLIPVFGEDYLRRLFVIVEMYDKRKYGRIKRAWMTEFNEKERRVVSRWYLRIYAWYLRTGIPYGGVRMSISTYSTLLKAANFFATI